MRQPVLFFLIVLFPFFLLGSLAYVISEMTTEEDRASIKVAVVDLDQTFETTTLVNVLQKEEGLQEALSIIPMSMEDSEAKLKSNDILATITIPDGFSRNLRSGNNIPIQVTTNESQPIEANMVKMLLDSAAYYISAAQSAINTVNDLYIRDMPDDENRKEYLQKLIVQYTLFALNRNTLLQTEEVGEGSMIGWSQHFGIAILLLSTVLSSILFQNFTFKREDDNIKERLRALHITPFVSIISQFLIYTFFSTITIVILSLIVNAIYPLGWLLSIQVLTTWMLFSIVVGTFLTVLDVMLHGPSSRSGIGAVGFLLLFLLSGIIIPSLYLPEWVQTIGSWIPFTYVLTALEDVILGATTPILQWGKMLVVSFLLILFITIRVWMKEGRDAYLSYSTK